ncbi:MAG: hypothetical protein LBI20_00730 [Holosporales bacterium]|jgi:hypothetical protein|nr:hypothetical protein [Holosporales bacterium]
MNSQLNSFAKIKKSMTLTIITIAATCQLTTKAYQPIERSLLWGHNVQILRKATLDHSVLPGSLGNPNGGDDRAIVIDLNGGDDPALVIDLIEVDDRTFVIDLGRGRLTLNNPLYCSLAALTRDLENLTPAFLMGFPDLELFSYDRVQFPAPEMVCDRAPWSPVYTHWSSGVSMFSARIGFSTEFELGLAHVRLRPGASFRPVLGDPESTTEGEEGSPTLPRPVARGRLDLGALLRAIDEHIENTILEDTGLEHAHD